MSAPDTSVTMTPEIVRNTRRNAAVLALQAAFREDRFFLMLSVFIGIFAGLIVVCFRLAIDWCNIFLLGPVPHAYSFRLLIAPAVVSLIVAVLVLHVFRGVRGSGVNQTKA